MEEERGDIWQVVIVGTRALLLRVALGFSHILEIRDMISLNQPRCFSGSHEFARVSVIQERIRFAVRVNTVLPLHIFLFNVTLLNHLPFIFLFVFNFFKKLTYFILKNPQILIAYIDFFWDLF